MSGNLDEILEQVRDALESGEVNKAIAALESLHPADRAEAFLDLEDPEQRTLLHELDNQTTADLLEEMSDSEALEVAASLPPEELAEVLDEMSPEGAADILGHLPEDQAASTLARMEEADEVQPLLQYPDDTAGGLMSPDFIAINRGLTVEQVIEHLRRESPESESPYYLYVTGERGELLGVLPLRNLITSPPSTLIEQIMITEVRSVPVDMPQDELAQLCKRYSLLLLPVLERDNTLVGVVKSRDLVEVMEEETEDDLFRLAGVAGAEYVVWSPLRSDVGRRLPWLVINLGTAFLAAAVVSIFESTIQKLAILAVFQGIVAGQGGNAATQTITLMVRGLALQEVEFKDIWEVLMREVLLGAINGIAIGIAVGIGAYLWVGDGALGFVVALAMVGTILVAGIAGTVVPLALKAVRLDPALASGVLVTTVTDCVGFGLFLFLASKILL